ncbi:MAG: Fur family transcriptional regulator [Betaproteobacteria bacterium]
MKPPYLARMDDAEGQIRATGERLTQPRTAVLAVLLAADHAIAHQDVAATLAAHHAIDRVTVYRVLDWLVDAGIAHRLAGDDRVWRFMLNYRAKDAGHKHAHFTCKQCGQTFCLNDIQTRLNFKLPAGFKSAEVDLTIRGACAHCS